MAYRMFLVLEGRAFELPVLPPKLQVRVSGKNESFSVLQLGEVNMLRKPGLQEVSWESFFPASTAPYVTGTALPPASYIKAINAHRQTEKPVQLIFLGTDLDTSLEMGIESFDYEERYGELGDIYYSIKLKEWKDYSPRRIVLLSQPKQEPVAQVAEQKRPGSPPPVETITVVKGDSLWAIAKRHYNDGSKYPMIYSANKDLIDARNKGTRNDKYTIYPGQVLTIP